MNMTCDIRKQHSQRAESLPALGVAVYPSSNSGTINTFKWDTGGLM